MARYSREQRNIINTALRLTRRDNPKVRRALLEAMAVESNFRNLDYGDRDSVGALQQRPSQGWGPGSESPETDMLQFLQRARRTAGKGYRGTAGSLAQSVQRSAFPDRYDDRRDEVNALMRGVPGGVSFAGGAAGKAGRSISAGTDKSAIVQYLLGRAESRATGIEGPGLLSLVSSMAQHTGGVNASTAGVIGSHKERHSPSSISGMVSLSPGADRAGVHTGRGILNFASKVAGIYGSPLVIGTGTNHNRMTVNGNVSQHWSGDAVDIPARGRNLIRMGQDALIAAGMNRKLARRQRGGLFNVGGRQIIFNTQEGGDHTDHLHLGR